MRRDAAWSGSVGLVTDLFDGLAIEPGEAACSAAAPIR